MKTLLTAELKKGVKWDVSYKNTMYNEMNMMKYSFKSDYFVQEYKKVFCLSLNM